MTKGVLVVPAREVPRVCWYMLKCWVKGQDVLMWTTLSKEM